MCSRYGHRAASAGPVKWTATRSESLLLDTQARDQVVYGELALDETGQMLAIRARGYQALGAYWWAAITAPLFFSMMLIPSLYDVQTVDSEHAGGLHQHRADVGLSRRGPAGGDLSDRTSARQAARVLGHRSRSRSAVATSSNRRRCPIRRQRATSTTAASSSG